MSEWIYISSYTLSGKTLTSTCLTMPNGYFNGKSTGTFGRNWH